MAIEFLYRHGEEVGMAVFSRPGEAVITVDLGSDPETGYAFSLFVALSELPGGIPAHSELAFWIGEIDPDHDTDYRYWDGRETKALIPDPIDRKAILNLIRIGTLELVETTTPSSIMTQTCSADLPDRALLKYAEILSVVEKCGYSTRELEPYHGRRAWLSERLT